MPHVTAAARKRRQPLPEKNILTDASVPLREKLAEAGRVSVADRDLIREVFCSLAESPCYNAYYRAAVGFNGSTLKVPHGFSILKVDSRAAEDITLAEFMCLLRHELRQASGFNRVELLVSAAYLPVRLHFTEDANERNAYHRNEDSEVGFALRQLMYAKPEAYLDYLCDAVADESMEKLAESAMTYLRSHPEHFGRSLDSLRMFEEFLCLGSLLHYCCNVLGETCEILCAYDDYSREYSAGASLIYTLVVLPFADYAERHGATVDAIRNKIEEAARAAY